MDKQEQINKMRSLGRLARSGRASQSEIQELSHIQSSFYKNKAQQPTSLWDLEITRRCWRDDAREKER